MTLKNKVPYPMDKNHRWDMDLTTIDQQQIFGMVDGGTRALLALKHLPAKSTMHLIRVLLDTIEYYGKPQSIKSDNEMVFTSKLMKFTLYLLGIRQQTTNLASPWQNGKIERLFGTMKQSLKDLVFPTTQSLAEALQEFRLFYNHIRPHQNLDYNTPANDWDNKAKPTSKTHSQIIYFRGLRGNIARYYFLE
ncbi:MAG: integrase core domain-containing protein [Sulfurovum sp.]|nr:integrase core domain-containing protein [Sulfurovum sp.]